ncbi:MAG: ATP-dependent sacrificial sulfur transferase LarE [Clostridiales bacterium]|nr:ATP-dependent sacrificial sulfur transferase LarE [Clostridiales bacterium]
MDIKEFFKLNSSVAVACSGGVDSAVLLFLAKKYAKECKAYFVKTEFQPDFEENDAREICKFVDIPLTVIEHSVLSEENIISNTKRRCYFCKKSIFTLICNHAHFDGFDTVIDGTNASDDIDDRAGTFALRELGVLSPLRLCGINKTEIRKIAKENDLFLYNKPSYACLATRIPFNTKITSDILKITEIAENKLSSLGFTDFRIRYLNGSAKLQLSKNDMELICEKRKEVVSFLSQYYDEIYLDLNERQTDE